MPEAIVTRILRLPGYGVYQHVFDEAAQTVTCWVRPTAPTPYYCCPELWDQHPGHGGESHGAPGPGSPLGPLAGVAGGGDPDRGLPTLWPAPGTRPVPGREGALHGQRLEAAVAQECRDAPVRRVAARWGLAAETVRLMDKRTLQRWAAGRPRAPLRQLGVDEIFLGKATKFLTVVSNLETREPLWMGKERKRETLDRFFAEALPPALAAGGAGRLRGHVGAVSAEPEGASARGPGSSTTSSTC